MKRDLTDFQPDVSVQPAAQVRQSRTRPASYEREFSIESLAYGAVMLSMFIAIIAFLVLTLVSI